MKLIKKLPKNIPSDVCWVSEMNRMWHSSAELLRSTRWNANLILTCDVAELVYVCEVIFWKTRILVRTAKWPPHIIFAGNCGQTQSVLPENHGQTMLKMSRISDHGLAMIFLGDSLRLSAVSLSRQRHDILTFSYCPLSRVLHVTLANWQRFGFEFHLRSSPFAYSGFVNMSRLAEYFTTLKRPNKVEKQLSTVAICLSVWTLSCRCPVKLPT